jgi:NAD-dependent deacetylase
MSHVECGGVCTKGRKRLLSCFPVPGLLERARTLLTQRTPCTVLTGAGVSAESGVPTFRGVGGLWRNFRPEDLATPAAFVRDPKLVWEWYDWRRQQIAAVRPNLAHHALASFAARAPGFKLVTQNVDGLHDVAGSEDPVKVHGDIWDLRCTRCAFAARDTRASLPELPPRCGCGAPLRPGVVWFGETLPAEAWARAEKAALSCGVFLVVGTSALVYPVAGLIDLAMAAGASVVEVNLDETPYSAVADVSLRGQAGDLVPRLLAP